MRTAAVTAPSDLWLLRHILGVHAELGLTERLLAGEAIHPEFCRVDVDGDRVDLDAEQLAIDLHFLLSRGVVKQYDESFRIAGHHRVRELLSSIGPLPDDEPVPATDVWRRLFEGKPLEDAELAALERLGRDCPPPRKEFEAGFKYVHEKSGQCLRPASPRPRPRLGPPLRAAWSECAKSAGYVRLDEYCTRTRTIYPYPRRDGHNPSISVNHFFVPRLIARELGVGEWRENSKQ